MDVNLKKIAEEISCSRINFIDKKYNYYNEDMFNKQIKKNNKKVNDDKNVKYLNSLNINNKSCIMTSTEPDEGLWKKQFEIINFKNNNDLFNKNTKAKLNTSICYNYN
jgi:hypothetical protein